MLTTEAQILNYAEQNIDSILDRAIIYNRTPAEIANITNVYDLAHLFEDEVIYDLILSYGHDVNSVRELAGYISEIVSSDDYEVIED